MPPSPLLAHFGLVLVIALAGAITARKFKQPLIVGYLLAGVVSGILISSFQLEIPLSEIAELGIALLLFSLGIEFSFARLSRVKLIAGLGATTQILTVIFLTLLLLPLFGIGLYQALFIGSALALSSTAVVARILEKRGELDTWPGELAIGWLLIQDLAVLPLVILLPALTSPAPLEIGAFWLVAKAFLLVLAAIVLGQRIVPRMVRFLASFNSRELLLLGVVCLMFGFAILTTSLGLGLVMGAFLAGLLISSSSAHYAIFAEVRPLREIFSVLFFVSLGLMITPVVLITYFPWLILGTLAVLVLKFTITWLILSYFGQHPRVKFVTAAYLTQVGEFGFVLMQLGRQTGVVSSNLVSLISGIALLSILAAPWVINQADQAYQWLKNRLKPSQAVSPPVYRDLGLKLKNHVVLCGYGRVGKWLGRSLQLFHLPFVVVDYNRQVISQLKRQKIPAVYGDPADLEVLDYAQVDFAKVVVIAIPDFLTQQLVIDNCRKLNPRVTILSRIHFEKFQQPLKLQGATQVVQPEFEAALTLTHKILQRFGKSKLEIANKMKRIRLEHGTT